MLSLSVVTMGIDLCTKLSNTKEIKRISGGLNSKNTSPTIYIIGFAKSQATEILLFLSRPDNCWIILEISAISVGQNKKEQCASAISILRPWKSTVAAQPLRQQCGYVIFSTESSYSLLH
jgi:hypothetical protein